MDKVRTVYVCTSVDTRHNDIHGSHTNSETFGDWKDIHTMLSEFLKDPHCSRFEVRKDRGVKKTTPNGEITYYEVIHDE